MGDDPEAPRRAEPPHYPPPSSGSWPGWMPPGTSVPPGLPGPPSRYPTRRGRNAGPLGNGPLGCAFAIALFLFVAGALVWVVVNRQ